MKYSDFCLFVYLALGLGTDTLRESYPMRAGLISSVFCLPLLAVAALAGEKGDLWTGPYGGASIGYAWGESKQSYDRAGDHGKATLEPDGAAAAITGGYNWMWDEAFLFGMEADIGVINVSQGATEVFDGHIWSTNIGPFWGTLRGRAGYAIDDFLMFVSGGLAVASIDDTSIGNTPGETAKEDNLRAGWVVGGGVEYALDDYWILKAEYLHMDFGRYEGQSANNEDYYFENVVDLIRFGANVRF